jgi:hypothetical protein
LRAGLAGTGIATNLPAVVVCGHNNDSAWSRAPALLGLSTLARRMAR